MSGSVYWQACTDLHVRLAQELRDFCWPRFCDCIVLERPQMLMALSVERIKKPRMTRFQEDVYPWFPHFEQMSKGRNDYQIHSCYLSRLPFPKGAMMGMMRTQDRQLRLCEAGLRTTIWSPEL